MNKLTRRQVLQGVLDKRTSKTTSRQEGGRDDFTFTNYVEFRGTKTELIEAIEAALDGEGS